LEFQFSGLNPRQKTKKLLGITTNTLNMILLLHVLANTEQIVNFRPSQLIAYMQEKRKPLEKKIILA